MSVSYEYTLKQTFESISSIFYQYGDTKYKDAFLLISRSILRTVCVSNDAENFIYNKNGSSLTD